MTPMKTDTSVLAKEAANFERIAAELKSTVAKVESTTESLAGHWRGGAGDAIRAALTKYHETAKHEFQQLDDISAKLQSAAGQYGSTDESQASELAKKMDIGGWANGTPHGGGASGGGHGGGGVPGGGHSGGAPGSGSGSTPGIPGGGFTGNHPEWSGTPAAGANTTRHAAPSTGSTAATPAGFDRPAPRSPGEWTYDKWGFPTWHEHGYQEIEPQGGAAGPEHIGTSRAPISYDSEGGTGHGQVQST